MNEGQYRVALEKEIETNAGLLRSYMTIILFIILETGWGNRSEDSVGAGRLPAAGDHIHTLYMCACACVCVYVCVCSRKKKSSAFMYICKSAYPFPLCTLIATLVRIAFNTETHETMGYKLAFQPDIFDMISASHLVSLLFVSFLP